MMGVKADIYCHARALHSVALRVQNSKISEKNKQLIFQFRDQIILDGMSRPRTIRYMEALKGWALLLNVDFDRATKQDIMGAVRQEQENDNHRPWTKSTNKTMLKRFFKWLKKTEELPEEVKWIRSRIKITERTLPSNGDMITEEEVKQLINAADHP